MTRLARLDREYLWHPFTQMRDWLRHEPTVIVSGQGAVLRDARGREFLDANASIWTNLHGHNHPFLNRAIRGQLRKIAHSSALGLANEPASLLARELVRAANPNLKKLPQLAGAGSHPVSRKSKIVNLKLERVFFSDNGSTALEVALKLAYESARRSGLTRKPRFLSLQGGYHGDTIGAVALGHIDLFHRTYRDLLFRSDSVMSPYCYRCPFNRARPERSDARDYRKCHWECVGKVEEAFARQKRRGNSYAAFVFEPLVQGAAGLIPQPRGWLAQVAAIARCHGAQLIADEVLTGFGRCGFPDEQTDPGGPPAFPRSTLHASRSTLHARRFTLFASHHEGVQPDFLCLAKGLTGGYLPMGATLTTGAVFDLFLGEYEEFKTFFHGHSYTGNQLGSAAALASLALLRTAESRRTRRRLQLLFREHLAGLWSLRNVGDIRQVGLIAGIELVQNWQTREALPLTERAGIRVCEAMARRGVLTRPIGNVVVLMPPYCTTDAQLRKMVSAAYESIEEVFGTKKL